MPTAEQFRRWAEELDAVAVHLESQAAMVRSAWAAGPIRGGRLHAAVAALVAEVELAIVAAVDGARAAAAACRRRAMEAA